MAYLLIFCPLFFSANSAHCDESVLSSVSFVKKYFSRELDKIEGIWALPDGSNVAIIRNSRSGMFKGAPGAFKPGLRNMKTPYVGVQIGGGLAGTIKLAIDILDTHVGRYEVSIRVYKKKGSIPKVRMRFASLSNPVSLLIDKEGAALRYYPPPPAAVKPYGEITKYIASRVVL